MLIHSEERGRSQSRLLPNQPHEGTPTPHRAFPEKPVLTKNITQDGRNSDTLRLAVLRNEHRRGSSRTTIDSVRSKVHTNPPNKNIPMLSDNNRWNSFAMQKAQEKPPAVSCEQKPLSNDSKNKFKWSVSPLTKLEKAAATLKKGSVPHRSPLNSVDSTDNRFDDLTRIGSSPKSNEEGKHVSINNSPSTLSNSFRPPSRGSVSSSDEKSIQGDLDRSPDRLSLGDDYSLKDTEAPSSVLDFMKDFANAHSGNVLQNGQSNQNYTSYTRTQQKMLDFKDLMQHESSEANAPQYSNLLDYATKIQNEAILAEWGQIRHRFSSYVSALTHKSIVCRAGVLGSLRRCKENGHFLVQTHDPLTEDKKDLFIKTIWFGEPAPTKEVVAEEPSNTEELLGSPGNYSLMARNVMASRESTPYE